MRSIVRTAPQIRSQGACGAFYWGNCKPIAGSHAVETMGWISSYLSRRPLPRSGGGVGGAEPSAASGGCSEAEHPQRSKKSSKRAARRFFRAPQGGGGRCAAAPYKHRLAYAPVRRGLGVYPKSLLNWGPRKVVRPCGERRAHRSGEGCPNQGVGSARLKRRLRPTRRSKSATPAVAVQIMPLRKPAPTISNHKNPARSFCGPGR